LIGPAAWGFIALPQEHNPDHEQDARRGITHKYVLRSETEERSQIGHSNMGEEMRDHEDDSKQQKDPPCELLPPSLLVERAKHADPLIVQFLRGSRPCPVSIPPFPALSRHLILPVELLQIVVVWNVAPADSNDVRVLDS
jgi:hypothetical protein